MRSIGYLSFIGSLSISAFAWRRPGVPQFPPWLQAVQPHWFSGFLFGFPLQPTWNLRATTENSLELNFIVQTMTTRWSCHPFSSFLTAFPPDHNLGWERATDLLTWFSGTHRQPPGPLLTASDKDDLTWVDHGSSMSVSLSSYTLHATRNNRLCFPPIRSTPSRLRTNRRTVVLFVSGSVLIACSRMFGEIPQQCTRVLWTSSPLSYLACRPPYLFPRSMLIISTSLRLVYLCSDPSSSFFITTPALISAFLSPLAPLLSPHPSSYSHTALSHLSFNYHLRRFRPDSIRPSLSNRLLPHRQSNPTMGLVTRIRWGWALQLRLVSVCLSSESFSFILLDPISAAEIATNKRFLWCSSPFLLYSAM